MPRTPLSRLLATGSRGRKLLAQTAGTLGLNGAALVLNLLLTVILSRFLGPAGYGTYAFAVAWSLLLAVPAMLGITPVVVREMARYRIREDWPRAHGLVWWSSKAVLVASLAVVVVSASLFLLVGWPASPLLEPTLVGLGLVPLLTLVAVRQSAMQGLGFVVLARAPESLVAPALTIALVLLVASFRTAGLSATSAVLNQVLAAGIATLAGIYLLRRTAPAGMWHVNRVVEPRIWLIGALPILLATVVQAVNAQAGTILTASLAGSEEAGVYGVAVRIAGLLPFLLLAAVPALMPAIAELSAKDEPEALQRLLTRAARLVLFGSLPLVLGAAVLAEPILRLFGNDFETGAAALTILCLGQLVSVSTGLAGTTLLMIGEAGLVTWAVAAGAVSNLALTAVLVPEHGAAGAATGAAAAIAVTNLLMAHALWRRRRLDATALGLRHVPS